MILNPTPAAFEALVIGTRQHVADALEAIRPSLSSIQLRATPLEALQQMRAESALHHALQGDDTFNGELDLPGVHMDVVLEKDRYAGVYSWSGDGTGLTRAALHALKRFGGSLSVHDVGDPDTANRRYWARMHADGLVDAAYDEMGDPVVFGDTAAPATDPLVVLTVTAESNGPDAARLACVATGAAAVAMTTLKLTATPGTQALGFAIDMAVGGDIHKHLDSSDPGQALLQATAKDPLAGWSVQPADLRAVRARWAEVPLRDERAAWSATVRYRRTTPTTTRSPS